MIEYSLEIIGKGSLPWEGLYTARNVYKILKESEIPLSPEEIGKKLDISAEYVNQIILALQNGKIEIESVKGQKSWTGRSKAKYQIRFQK